MFLVLTSRLACDECKNDEFRHKWKWITWMEQPVATRQIYEMIKKKKNIWFEWIFGVMSTKMWKINWNDTHLSGYIRRPLSIPGQYERNAANAVSNTNPKFNAQFRIPWWTIEFRRVLQIIKSAHCTTTIDTKKAVWHVNSSVFRSRYVCKWTH